MDQQITLKMDLPLVPAKMELAERSIKVYQRLMKYDQSAAQIFARANAAPRIDRLDNTEVRDRGKGKPSTDLTAACKYILKAVTTFTGLDFREPGEISAALQMIRMTLPHYGHFTHHEIAYAFELNAMGRFPEQVQHYQKFTPDFIGKVLKSYSAERMKVAQTISNELSYTPAEPLKELPPAEPDPIPAAPFVLDALETWQKSGIIYLPVLVYQKLVDAGIRPINAFEGYRERARAKMIGERTKDGLKSDSRDRTDARGNVTRIGSAVSIGAAIEAMKLDQPEGIPELDTVGKRLCVIDFFQTLTKGE